MGKFFVKLLLLCLIKVCQQALKLISDWQDLTEIATTTEIIIPQAYNTHLNVYIECL